MSNKDTSAVTFGVTAEMATAIELGSDKASATTRKTLQFRSPTIKVGEYKVVVTVEREPQSSDEEAFIVAERSRIDGNARAKAQTEREAREREKLGVVDLTLAAALKADALMTQLRRG